MRIFKSTTSVSIEDFAIEFNDYRLWFYRLGRCSFSPIHVRSYLYDSEKWEEI